MVMCSSKLNYNVYDCTGIIITTVGSFHVLYVINVGNTSIFSGGF